MSDTPEDDREDFDSFVARFANVLPDEDRIRIEHAYFVAKNGHRHQTRQETDAHGEPIRYFEHPRRVAITLVEELRCYEVEMVQAGLLHDVEEDNVRITNDHIRVWISKEVARLVKCVTHEEGDEKYPEHLIDLGDWRPMLLKFCDRLDNTRTLKGCPPDKQVRKAIETRDRYYPVFNELQRLLPNRYLSRFVALYDELRGLVNGLLPPNERNGTGSTGA
jgi:GTP pyrophosphokinase